MIHLDGSHRAEVESGRRVRGGDKLIETTFIQRLNTAGGVAPAASTCAAATDAGKKALVPYSADYFFYKEGK